MQENSHGKNHWILVRGVGQKLPKGRKHPRTNEHLMITATEVNVGMTNTSDDNDVFREVFRLPKYLQKCVARACLYACMSIHAGIVPRIITALEIASK